MGSNCSNITYPDDNLTEYVNQIMGPRCLDPNVAIVTVFFYSLIFILGLLGNLFTCVVIIRNNYMHTATNYYLLSLAVSDLISLVLGLPFELVTTLTYLWPDPLPEYICKLRSFVTETTSAASVLTITAFSVERWLAICFPLKVKLFSKLERAIKVIIGVWLTACVSATPVAFFAILNRIELPEHLKSVDHDGWFGSITDDGGTVKDTDVCALDFSRPRISGILLSFSFYCFFLLPMLIICVLYVHIGITVKVAAKTQTRMNDAVKHDVKHLKRRLTVIRMLVSVVVCFFTCWLPFHIQRLSSLYFDTKNMSAEMTHFFHLVFFVSGYFYYANSAVNPILYNVMNARFRCAFVQTLRICQSGSKSDSQHQHILDASGCVRSSCSNVVALIVSNQRLISVASAAPLSTSSSFLNTANVPNRRVSLPSMTNPTRRTGARAKCSLVSVREHDDTPLRSPCLVSASTGALSVMTSRNRRRSSNNYFLKPPTPFPRRK